MSSSNISISEYTSDSKLVTSNINSCCWSGRVECCLAQFATLNLVKDADWPRGSFSVACYAFGARSSWHISIRDGGKNSHFECVKIIRSSQEILCLLLAVQLDCKMIADRGKSKGSCKLLVLSSQNWNTPCGPPYNSCYASLPDVFTVKNASALMLSFSCREIHRSCKVLISSILFRKMLIRSNQLHYAFHYDQPISVYFLDRRRGRES